MMTDLKTLLPTVALATALAAVPGWAQQTTAEQPAEQPTAEATEEALAPDQGTAGEPVLDMGTPVDAENDGMGQPYIKDVSGDWQVQCIKTPLEADPCALHQLLKDENDNSVATIELVNLPVGGQAVAGATIVTPLETLLREQIVLSVDGGEGRRYPFDFCTPRGCVARVGFTEGAVDAFRRGNSATLTIVPLVAPDQNVSVNISLKGFTAGYEMITELNAANAEALNRAAAEQGQGGN